MIKRSNEINHEMNFAMLLYGKPGSSKSTTACSAPSPLLIDVDRGIHRIHAPARPTSYIQPESYPELLNDLGGDLSEYRTIVIDTLGRLLELMSEHAGTINPKFRQADGTLTLKGWGWLGTEFGVFAKRLRALNKYVIYVAHAAEENDGDTKVYRVDAGGRARKEIFKDMDIVGFMEIQGILPAVNFAPNERYYTKNSIGITEFERLPNILQGAENNYLTNLFLRIQQKVREEGKLNQEYIKVKAEIKNHIEAVSDPETASQCLTAINKLTHVYHSLAEAKHLLSQKIQAIGIRYDRQSARFVEAKK